jgi:SAM-dependent methyltransferase
MAKAAVNLRAKSDALVPSKLDLGCGKNPREGFIGVDALDFGQHYVLDLTKPWPWKDDSVEEVHCSHFVEHLKPDERIHFINELYRVLKKDGKATIIVPSWSSERAYGDLTHQWPPVTGFWFSYLAKDWRAVNAPHNTEYTCDFKVGDVTWGFSLHPNIQPRNQEYQMHALTFWKEAAQDMIATLTKR